ncbi:hypothetical protein G9A89_001115 [Geosiphon pyriformis]|nr:hypothetical protein G9A89_001115 [Geosiphon pyriformis]
MRIFKFSCFNASRLLDTNNSTKKRSQRGSRKSSYSLAQRSENERVCSTLPHSSFTVDSIGREALNPRNSIFGTPINLAEQDRLQTQHFLLKYVWGSNFSSPVTQILEFGGAKVLDVGCGPGTWCLDMATDYESSEFFGIDISPLFPSHIKPPNTTFLLADILSGLPFQDNYFDFIYLRNMSLEFTVKQCKEIVIPELTRIVKPGGFIECMDYCFPKNFGPTSKIIFDLWADELVARKFDPNMDNQFFDLLSSQPNIIDIKKEYRAIPLGNWGKMNGRMALNDVIQLLQLIGPSISLSGRNLENFLEEFKKECELYKHENTSYRIFAIKHRNTI